MQSIERAVILAAGRGSRMGVEGPKCLQPVAGKPIVEWTLDALRQAGIRDVTVVGGFEAAMLEPLATAHRVALRTNARWASTNMVRSLQVADDLLRAAPALVVYGDGAYGARSLSRVVERFDADIALPVDRAWLDLWRLRFDDPLADAETLSTRDGHLVSIGARPSRLDQVEGQFMGLIALRPRGWSTVSAALAAIEAEEGAAAVDRMDCTTLLSRLLARSTRIDCIDVDGGWCEFDSRSDCTVVERALEADGFRHDFRR